MNRDSQDDSLNYFDKKSLLFVGFILLFLVFFYSACLPSNANPTATNQIEVEAPTTRPDQSAIIWAWEASPHANTYALEKGPNTYCAKCHSPINWDPAATIDPPPNCVSCKFPHEPEMRIATGNPPVEMEDWQNIGCEVCHRVKDGIAQADINWLDIPTGYYETVTNSTSLCEKCHLDNETLNHQRDFSGTPHEEFTCTDCHDAHSAQANCSAGGCHLDFADKVPVVIPEHLDQVNIEQCTECHKSIDDIHMNIVAETPTKCFDCHGRLFGSESKRYLQAHSSNHADVWCVACHDASGLEVGLQEDINRWVAFRSLEFFGQISIEPYKSHNVQLEVDCTRCHFPDNPWDLNTFAVQAFEATPPPEAEGTPVD